MALSTAVSSGACAQIVGIEDLATREVEDEIVEDASTETEPPPDAGTDVPVDARSSTPKRVFVTTGIYRGRFVSEGSPAANPLVAADNTCTAAARMMAPNPDDSQAAPRFIAWLSDGTTNAIDRIDHDGPYRLVDGTMVVSSKSQLASGTLSAPIDVTPDGTRITGETAGDILVVWTGTRPSGMRSEHHCTSWTAEDPAAVGQVGQVSASDTRWTEGLGPDGNALGEVRPCSQTARLYCFEL